MIARRHVLLSAVAAGIAGAAHGTTAPADAQGTAPKKPIYLSVEVGSFSSLRNRCEVAIAVQVNGDAINSFVMVREKSISGAELQISADAEPESLRTAIGEVAAKAEARVEYSAGSEHVTVAATVRDGSPVVKITKKEDGAVEFKSRSIEMDTDNAALLVQAIDRAMAVHAWMRPRLQALKSTSRIPN